VAVKRSFRTIQRAYVRDFNDKFCAPYLTITLTSLLRHSYEGKVLYFLDGDGKVIGLVKVETKSRRHTCRSGLTRLACALSRTEKDRLVHHNKSGAREDEGLRTTGYRSSGEERRYTCVPGSRAPALNAIHPRLYTVQVPWL
jgi:hypothetical protein